MGKNTTTIELILEDGQVIQSATRINAALASVEASSKKIAETNWDKFAENVKNFIENPLQSAGQMAENLLKSLGPVGSGIAAVGVVSAAAGKAAFDLASHFEEVAHSAELMSARTGLSVQASQLWTRAAEVMHIDSSTLETSMRGLSKALSDNSDEGKKGKAALEELGISARNATTGGLREMDELLPEIFRKLGEMEAGPQRTKLAIDLLNRAAVQLIPLAGQFDELAEAIKKTGAVIDDKGMKSAGEFHKMWALLKLDIEGVVLALGNAAASGITTLASGFSGNPLGEKGNWKPDTWDKEGYSNPLRDAWIAQNDRRVAQLQEPATLEERLSLAKRELSGLQGQLVTGVYPSVNDETAKEIEAKRALIQTIEDEITARKEGTFKLKAAVDAAHPERLNPETGQYFNAGKTLPTVPSLYGPTWAGSDFTSTLVVGGPEYNKWNAGVDAASKEQEKAYATGALAAGKRADEQALQMHKEAVDYQTRMIELLAGPGGEVAAIEKIYQLRLSEAETIQDVQKASIAHEEHLAELQQKHLNDFRDGTMRAFDALISGGASGLDAFFKSFAVGTVRTMVGNIAGIGYSAVQGKLNVPGQWETGADGTPQQTTFGKILAGTPFASDPSRSLNNSAAQLTLAAVALKSAAGALGGGTAGRGLFGGGDLGGGVFSALPSSGGDESIGGLISDQAQVYGGNSLTLEEANAYVGPDPGGMSWGRAGLYGAGIAAGTWGAVSGFKRGGAKGALAGTASVLGTAALVDPEPISKAVLAVAAMVTGFVGSILGDPKKIRDAAINQELKNAKFTMPNSQTVDIDMQGRALAYDRAGMLVQVNVQTMDSRSFQDNAHHIADAVTLAMRTHGPLVRGVQIAAGTRGF